MTSDRVKREQMTALAEYKRNLWEHPILRNLFLELTLKCNENCIHCGSRCGETKEKNELTYGEYCEFLTKVKNEFDIKDMMLCITGGEPLLRRDFFEIMEFAHSLGFTWGMTSNGTLITKEIAERLHHAGMSTISISIDGVRETHDNFRRTLGGYDAAIKGINALLEEGGFSHIQVTTVVHKQNIHELEAMLEIFSEVDIDSWRVISMEPIGRAKEHKELLLDAEDYKYLFQFIKEKRAQNMPVSYGCSHYLGEEYEREVRDWYFLCNAGIYTASIMANGDIGACLDIERRSELIQGNIRTDDFKRVWEEKFLPFRTEDYRYNDKCSHCGERLFCQGGSFHSWDFNHNYQTVCFKNMLF